MFIKRNTFLSLVSYTIPVYCSSKESNPRGYLLSFTCAEARDLAFSLAKLSCPLLVFSFESYLFICTALLGLCCAQGIFRCHMWDLVPRPGMEPGWAPCIGSSESQLSDHQGSPKGGILWKLCCALHSSQNWAFAHQVTSSHLESRSKKIWSYHEIKCRPTPNSIHGQRWLCLQVTLNDQTVWPLPFWVLFAVSFFTDASGHNKDWVTLAISLACMYCWSSLAKLSSGSWLHMSSSLYAS